MHTDFRLAIGRVVWGVLAAMTLSAATWAQEGNSGSRAPVLPAYTQECAACHVAYPPGMLPKTSWERLTSNLGHHFGVDASLDPATRKQLSDWLVANAGTYRRVREEPPDDRITRSAWFVRQHGEISAATWKRPAVKSASNCSACHTQAEKGDFNERNVRIPR